VFRNAEKPHDSSAKASADLSAFDRNLRAATHAAHSAEHQFVELLSSIKSFRFAVEAFRAPSAGPAAAGASSGGTGGLEGGIQLAAQLNSTLKGVASPIANIGLDIERMIDRVGGTVTVLAHKIESAMKFGSLMAGLNLVSKGIDTLFNKTTQASAQSSAQVQKNWAATFGQMAVKGAQGILTLKSALSSLGTVKEPPLSKLSNVNFNVPTASAAKLAGNLGTVTAATHTATGAVKNFGSQLLVALGVFGAAFKIVQFFKSGIAGASDLAETTDKLSAVFGKADSVISAAAGDMAKKFGTPKREFMEGAAAIGQLGLSAGKTQKDAAELGVTFAKLAADLASQDNLSFEEAATKLRSGLAGEAEPLRKHGVLLDEANLKAYAYAKGIAKAGKELTSAQKVEARAGLIKQKLARVDGDLARTSGSAANQFRKAGGGFQNFASTVGGLLLPAVKKAAVGFNELLATGVEVFESNRGMFQSWADAVSSAIDTVTIVIRNWPDVWEIVKLSVQEKLANLLSYFEVLPQNLSIIGNWIASNWKELIVDAVNGVGAVFSNLGKNIANLWKALQGFFAGEGFKFDWTPLTEGFKATADALPALIEPQLVSLQDKIDAAGGRIAEREAQRAAQAKKDADDLGKRKLSSPIDDKDAARLEELGKKVPKIIEDSMTPLDKFTKDLRELREMRAKGLLDDKQFNLAATKLGNEFVKDNSEGRDARAAAVTLGSQEARSAVLQHRALGERDPIKQVAQTVREQLTVQKQQLEAANRLGGLLKSGMRSVDQLQLPL
jgi:hypothetical protein